MSSITGQNERWAQLAAYQTPPAAQSSEISGGTSAYASSSLWADPGAGAVTGNTSSPISDGTNFALMAFGSSSQSATNGNSIASDGTSGISQLLTDLQSLLSSISGTSSATGSNATSATSTADADSASVSNSGTTTGTLSQDLQQLSTDLGSLASTMGRTHRGDHDHPEAPPAPPPGSGDILNTGTASASNGSDITNSGTASTGNGWATFMQQFAAGAYSSGYDASTTSSLVAINA
nr:hypothetical protein [uncultured Rhodopila sp.]